MAQYDKKCLVCGKEYQYCNNCNQYSHLPSYMNMFCSEVCKDLMMVVSNYEAKQISKEDAKNKINKIGITRNDSKYSEGIQKGLREILKEEKVENKSSESNEVKEKDNQKDNENTAKTEDEKQNLSTKKSKKNKENTGSHFRYKG